MYSLISDNDQESRIKDQECRRKNFLASSRSGFTLVEMTVVVGVLSVLLGFISTNLVSFQRSTDIQSARTQLITDLYGQRMRAMVGETQGQATPTAYGVYFEQHQYTLFRGANYAASASGNRTVPVQTPLQVTTTLPGNTIVFTAGSGAVASYSATADTIVLSTVDAGEEITIELNGLGTVTQGAP